MEPATEVVASASEQSPTAVTPDDSPSLVMRLREFVTPRISGRFGPLKLALVLAFLATPAVFVYIGFPDWRTYYKDAGRPPLPAEAFLMAVFAVGAAGVAGGAMGALVVRRRPVIGLAIAMTVAWPVAIASLPIVPTVLRIPWATSDVCLFTCSGEIRAGDLLSGAAAYAESLEGLVVMAMFTGIVAVPVILVLGYLAWQTHIRPFGAAVVVGAYGWANFMSVSAAPLPFIALAVGVLIWAGLLASPHATPPSEPPPADPVSDPGIEGAGSVHGV